jgi:nitrite transporter NirC
VYSDAIQALSGQAAAKLEFQKRSLLSHMIRSAMAGMYVGGAIVLIYTIGGLLAKDAPGAVRLTMGVAKPVSAISSPIGFGRGSAI